MSVETNEVKALVNQWNDLINSIIGEFGDPHAFQDLAKRTFKLLSNYEGQNEFPRPLVELLILMIEFSKWGHIFGDDKIAPLCEIAALLTWQCIEGFETCNSTYPVLNLKGHGFSFDSFNFDNDDIFELNNSELPF